MDAEAELWKRRLDGVAGASSRCRFLFGAMLLLAGIQIVGVWNQYLSYEIALVRDLHSAEPDLASTELTKAVAQQWIQSLHVAPPFMGVRLGVVDAAILGTVALLVILAWYYLALRRENHLIWETFHSALATNDAALARLVLVAVNSVQVFSNTTGSDAIERNPTKRSGTRRRGVALQLGIRVLYFAGPLACFAALVGDIWSLGAVSPVRNRVIGSRGEAFEDWRFYASVMLCAATTVAAVRCWNFAEGTTALLRAMHRRVEGGGPPNDN